MSNLDKAIEKAKSALPENGNPEMLRDSLHALFEAVEILKEEVENLQQAIQRLYDNII